MAIVRAARLQSLLAANRGNDPAYAGDLSNHLSMALVAAAALGASDERLAAFADRYATRLTPMRPRRDAVDWDRWRDLRGNPDAFAALLPAFAEQLATRGRDAVLAEVLPALLPSLSALLFHGLIRVAYAIRADDDDELAHGLAYWACGASPLRPLVPATGEPRDPSESMTLALADTRLSQAIRSGASMERLGAAASRPGFDAHVAAMQPPAHPCASDRAAVAVAALDVFRRGGDFIALHLVTGTQALGVLWPWLDDPAEALRWQWQGVLAGALTLGASPRAPVTTTALDWDTIATTAIASDDEHDIKLVDACRQEAIALGEDARWSDAAATRLRLGDPGRPRA